MGLTPKSDNLTILHYMTSIVCHMSYFMSSDVRKVSDAPRNQETKSLIIRCFAGR